MSDLLHRRLFEPLRSLLKQGMSAERLALCVAIGIVVGNTGIALHQRRFPLAVPHLVAEPG